MTFWKFTGFFLPGCAIFYIINIKNTENVLSEEKKLRNYSESNFSVDMSRCKLSERRAIQQAARFVLMDTKTLIKIEVYT